MRVLPDEPKFRGVHCAPWTLCDVARASVSAAIFSTTISRNSTCSQSHESKRHHALNLQAELCGLEGQCEPRTKHFAFSRGRPSPGSALYRLLPFPLRLERLSVGRRRFLSTPRARCAATVLRGLIATDSSAISTASGSFRPGAAVCVWVPDNKRRTLKVMTLCASSAIRVACQGDMNHVVANILLFPAFNEDYP